MTRSFLNSSRRLATEFLSILMLAAVASFVLVVTGIANKAQAQTSVALPGVTVSSGNQQQPPAPIGLNIMGWQGHAAEATGYTVGGDGQGQVVTNAGGNMNLIADGFMTGNSNRDCVADCRDTQMKVGIQGAIFTGSHVTNQGQGTQANPVISRAAGQSMLGAGFRAEFKWAAPPTSTP